MTHNPNLPAADRNRLVAMLGLLASDKAGERDAAALAATRLVKRLGIGWDEVVVRPGAQPGGKENTRARESQPGCAQGWRADLATCTRHFTRLTPWEQEFCLSLRVRRRSVSPKQAAVLAGIVAELRRAGCQ